MSDFAWLIEAPGPNRSARSGGRRNSMTRRTRDEILWALALIILIAIGGASVMAIAYYAMEVLLGFAT